jgi:hypothetical protein
LYNATEVVALTLAELMEPRAARTDDMVDKAFLDREWGEDA